MGGSNQPSKWWMPKDSNFGVPQPQYVIPAAYINKQAAEWPQGRYLPPCIIPPPTVTIVGQNLIVNGTSVVLPLLDSAAPQRVEFAPIEVFPAGDAGDQYVAPGIGQGATLVLRGGFVNSGVDTATSAVIKLHSLTRFNAPPGIFNPQVTITIGPAVTLTTYQAMLDGFVIGDIPATGNVVIEVLAQTTNTGNLSAHTYTASCSIGIRGGPHAVEFNLANNDVAFSFLVHVEP